MSPRMAVRDIALFERQIRFSRPFRFGAVTVEAAPQAFVRVEIDVEGRGRSVGASAEMMVPKWFDKRPTLSPADTVDELRRSLSMARELYLSADGFATAFALHASVIEAQLSNCAREDIPALAAAFGVAEIDKAVVDALFRALETGFFRGMADNLCGIDLRMTPDLKGTSISHFLSSLRPKPRVAVRHTVGLDDELEGPHGIRAIATEDGTRYFKLKLGGKPDADAMRLGAIAREIDTIVDQTWVTLDANEQYPDIEQLGDLVDRLDGDAALLPIAQRLLYIEQPMPRDISRNTPLGSLARMNFIIDEADGSYDALPVARTLGYRGVSSKSCKGLYKSILNAARAAQWSSGGEAYFITGEDLTCQAGLGVQQDLALGALLGLAHAERNGHHYVDGFAGAPDGESRAFLQAHPDLYTEGEAGVRLSIHDGALSTSSLDAIGFASGAHPDWASLSSLHTVKENNLQEH
jgi:hypothetical protein